MSTKRYFASQRHRWFSSFFGQGKQSGAGTATHDDGKGIFRWGL
jgi:hypothetical protein